MTNLDKFREVFGFTLSEHLVFECPFPPEICKKLPTTRCKECPIDGWWGKEYKESFHLNSDYAEE